MLQKSWSGEQHEKHFFQPSLENIDWSVLPLPIWEKHAALKRESVGKEAALTYYVSENRRLPPLNPAKAKIGRIQIEKKSLIEYGKNRLPKETAKCYIPILCLRTSCSIFISTRTGLRVEMSMLLSGLDWTDAVIIRFCSSKSLISWSSNFVGLIEVYDWTGSVWWCRVLPVSLIIW